MVEDPFLENDMGILEALESEGLPKASLRLDHVEGVRVFVPRGSEHLHHEGVLEVMLSHQLLDIFALFGQILL